MGYKVAKIISLLGVLAMTAVIGWAFATGNFGEDGAKLLALPWGVVSMVDLYVGFIVFSVWIVFRERCWWKSVIWVILMMTLGSFTASLYLLVALQQGGGDWKKVWLGKNYPA